MRHLGDITKINGAEIEPVDIISFGSPCQDLSVAGKQAGLAGERSGLFYAAIRVIREMRAATGGRYPRWIIWENVPGAFSSQQGRDFGAVISEIAETQVPAPHNYKWATAGMVELSDRAICWRVLDAQYWGVPQRRKRVFVVASFGDNSAAQILFKPESLQGDFAKVGAQREAVAGDVEKGTRTLYSCGGFSNYKLSNVASTQQANRSRNPDSDLLIYANNNQDSRVTGPHKLSPTLTAKMGMGGGNVPLCFGFRGYGDYKQTDKSKTLMRDDDITTGDLILPDYAARRLIPLECERLQYFPDDWTAAGVNENGAVCDISDAQRYKATGNSIAVCCAEYIFGNIAELVATC